MKHFFISLLAFATLQTIAQEKVDSLRIEKGKKAHNTEENRNVMLNASSNSGPREVNIGLPSSVGGITVLENDLPVVYYFWPELPTRTWRPSQSLNMRGLISVGESALTIGDFGYAVNTYTKVGGDKTELAGTLKANHHGYYLGDVNFSGRIKSSNWYYSVGALVTGDPGEAKHKGSKLIDDTQIFRGVLSYKSGDVWDANLSYKYARSRMIGHYAPFIYHIDGSVSEYNGIGIGTDSYMLRSGEINLKNILTGEAYTFDYDGRNSELWSSSHNIDFFGGVALGNDWKFKYSNRFHLGKSSAFLPLLVGASLRGTTGYTYVDDGTPYTGEYVQQMLAVLAPRTKTTTWQSRFWTEKKTDAHNWRIGFLGQYYKVDNYRQDRAFLFHSVEVQPRLLLRNGDTDPFFNYNAGGEYHNGYETKMSIYASDTWNATPWLDLSYGANFQYQKLKGQYSLQPRVPNVILNQFTDFDHNWFHINADVKAVVKLTSQFGLIGNFTYQEKHGQLENYSGAYTPNFAKTKTPYIAGGVYFNSDWVSLVSQVSTLTRNNYQTRLNLTDRTTGSTLVESVQYDIKTLGWTTDMVLKPFKNFQLHYLLTLQNPTYNNYSFINPHNTSETISYNGNVVMGISKVLMEIDPSYSIGKFRFGMNFRYFSKQYVSLTNQFFIEPRWESFFTSSYQINKNLNFGFNVVNIFNQTGASTSIAASELPYTNIQDAEGRLQTGSYIRPLTFEFQLGFKF